MSVDIALDLDSACGSEPSSACRFLFEVSGDETVARLGEWLVVRPLTILIIVAVAWLARRVAHRAIANLATDIVEHRAERKRAQLTGSVEPLDGDGEPNTRLAELLARDDRSLQRTETMQHLLRSLTTTVVITISTLLIFGELGISLGPLIAGAGVVGVALGFGAQFLVRDLIAGVFLLIEDQFGQGDIVDVGEVTGTVERVGLRITTIRDISGTLWFVPNGEISRVGNMSQLWARVILDIEVAYDTDIGRAIEVIAEVADELRSEAREDATIIDAPEVWGVESLGSSAIAIRLAVKTEPSEQFGTARLLRRGIKEAFDRDGIEIPYPQQVVHLRDGPTT